MLHRKSLLGVSSVLLVLLALTAWAGTPLARPVVPSLVASKEFPDGTATPAELCGSCHQAIYREFSEGFGSDMHYPGIVYQGSAEKPLTMPAGASLSASAHAAAGVDPFPIHARDAEEGGRTCNVCHFPQPFALPDLESREIAKPTQRVDDDAVSIKRVWREGCLQDRPGLSLATEAGVLLPTIHGEPGTGGRLIGIASNRWKSVTAHLNLQGTWTRAGTLDLFSGLILEGRQKPVRPVLEIFAERELGAASTLSALVGGIWQVGESLSFDAGFRVARAGDEPIREIRIGLTWDFSRE